MPAHWSRTERQPAGGKNSNEVSAGKEQYVSRNCADTLDHTVRTLAYLCWRFASRTAVSEQLPVWAVRKYLGRAPPFIIDRSSIPPGRDQFRLRRQTRPVHKFGPRAATGW